MAQRELSSPSDVGEDPVGTMISVKDEVDDPAPEANKGSCAGGRV